MMDHYRQIVSGCSYEIKIKGSRFIGESGLALTVGDAEAFLAKVKKREYNATHHCWAYRIGPGGQTYRFNDDGEPSGTAGQPILRHIDALDITNVIVVVTRYYGGTKLGTGGLIRAYGDAARYTLEACKTEEKVIRLRVRVVFAYDDTSIAMRTINAYDANIESSVYHDQTELFLAIRTSEAEAFREAFIENLRGRGHVEMGLS